MFELTTNGTSKLPFLLRLSKLFADPLRIRVVSELTMRPMSPKEFFEEFGGGSLSRVARHFKVLHDYGWIELVDEKSGGARRGAIEHFYRTVEPAVFDEEHWAELPGHIKTMITWRIFSTFAERVKEAMESGTIDARPERHFTWSPARYDKIAWDRILEKTMELYDLISEEQTAANERMAESGEEPIPVIVALSVFETPAKTDEPKAP